MILFFFFCFHFPCILQSFRFICRKRWIFLFSIHVFFFSKNSRCKNGCRIERQIYHTYPNWTNWIDLNGTDGCANMGSTFRRSWFLLWRFLMKIFHQCVHEIKNYTLFLNTQQRVQGRFFSCNYIAYFSSIRLGHYRGSRFALAELSIFVFFQHWFCADTRYAWMNTRNHVFDAR